MKIGLIFRPNTINARYRVVIPMAAMRDAGHEIHEFPQVAGGSALPFDEVAGCELVHIHRFVPNDDDGFVARLRAQGVVVTFDNDDDVGAAPPEALDLVEQVTHVGYAAAVAEVFERTLKVVAQADLVTVPSEALGERLRAAGAERVRVIDNRLPDRFLDVVALPRQDRVTIGWHGCTEHHHDYRTLGLREVLTELLDKHEHVHLRSVHLDLDLASERYRRIEWVEFEQLTKRLAHFDLGIAPVLDNAFNRSRSNVKVREYSAARVPWLASPVGPYARLGESEGGRLVADDDWFEALEQMVTVPHHRHEMSAAARAWAERETISKTFHLWEDAFSSALEAAELSA